MVPYHQATIQRRRYEPEALVVRLSIAECQYPRTGQGTTASPVPDATSIASAGNPCDGTIAIILRAAPPASRPMTPGAPDLSSKLAGTSDRRCSTAKRQPPLRRLSQASSIVVLSSRPNTRPAVDL